MSIDSEMAEIAQLFIEESREGLDVMESGLLNLDLGAADPETMNAIFRAAHSIKGGGATFGFTEVSDFAHHVETLLDEMRQGEREVTREGVDLVLASVDCMRDMVEALADGNVDTTVAKQLEARIQAMLANEEAPAEAAAAAPTTAAAPSEPTPSEESAATASDEATESQDTQSDLRYWQIDFRPHATILQSCNDPVRILRSLDELGETTVNVFGTDNLTLSKLETDQCHLRWTIELRADVERETIEEVFSWVTDECDLAISEIQTDNQSATPGKPAAAVEQATGTPPSVPDSPPEKPVEPAATLEVAEPATPSEEKPAADAKEPSPKLRKSSKSGREPGSIRVNIDKIDALINLVGELVITQSMLSRFDRSFDMGDVDRLREGLSQLSRNTRDIQESVMGIRMLPISFAFSRFPRLVRDTGNALGKKVELRLRGENTELDKTVLEKIGDPLVHLVRNSLDHGLEMPEDRVAAGKPETGVLELNAFHEGGNIVIEVIDDGGGINTERVLQKARERGLVGPDETLSEERINNLIFMPGFSTVDVVSDLSGRGVGMDVVRRNISDLGGSISVKSERGVGSCFSIRLPLTLAILDGQLIRVGEESYIIPLISILETIQVPAGKINEIGGSSELFQLRDEYLPVLRLHEVFGVEADSENIEDGLLVVAESSGQRVGVFVDDLLEQQQVVIKSLEANYRQMLGISGATILGDGTVALILDIPGLIQLFNSRKRQRPVQTSTAQA